MQKVSINEFSKVIKEVWQTFTEAPYPELTTDLYWRADKNAVTLHMESPYFKSVADYVDEAWERNR